jgi:hypothetical protein
MSGSFDALACAAVAKSDMLDHHIATIASLTVTVADLTATNKKLVDQLSAALATCVKPPPGITASPTPTTTATPSTTCHMVNTAGITCPAKIKLWGRCYFINKQMCSTCVKSTTHVQNNCLELPHNAERKKKVEAQKAARKLGKN